MEAKDVKAANYMLEELRRVEFELKRIDQLASRLSTEKLDVCCNINLIEENEDHHHKGGGGIGWLTTISHEAAGLHTHFKESECLEILGTMVSWRQQKKKVILEKLKEMGITP